MDSSKPAVPNRDSRGNADKTQDRLRDAAEMAELLGVPERWVRDQTRAGVMPHVRLGRYVRYDRSDVLAWIEGLKHPGRPADWQRIRPRQYQKAVPSGR